MKKTSNEELRVLLLEDSEIDADLLVRELKRHGLAFRSQRVDTRDAFRDALTHFAPDLVLSDLTMPAFDGIEGLKMTREMYPAVPFIYVSGTIGEERAIDLLRQGATDYVLKQNLARLGPVVGRALREAAAQRKRRITEEQLRKLSRAVEQSPSAIMITDADGNIEYVNPKFIQVTGYSAEDVIGQSPRILKSGETPPSTYEELWRTIKAGGEWRGEFHNRRKNGELFWESVSISPSRDDSGAITHFVAVKEDITERKQMEAQLRHAQRLESIGALASGLAHDLNNILAPIVMAAPLLNRNMDADEFDRILSIIGKSAERGVDVVKQVLAFGGRGLDGERRAMRLAPLVNEIEKIAIGTFPKNITFERSLAPALWSVTGDPTQIHQVLLNLCVNARDAMPQGGTLRIAASNIEIDTQCASMAPGAKPGPHVLIEVSDSGAGIPAETQERIFDPFFTTKEPGKGTGLGLSTVFGIVKSHGGFLCVESQPGQGATFKVFLPAEPEAAGAPEAPPAAEAPLGNGELIMVVDDEVNVRITTEAALQTHGYRVLLAADGIEAIAAFARKSGDIAAVITDVAMPYMDGVALIRVLRKMKPDLRVIVSTGHGEKAQVSEQQCNAFLNKPYGVHTLLQTLHSVLAPPGGAIEAQFHHQT